MRCRHETGDIIAHVSTPKVYEYLIACNGQRFDKAKYPQLATIYPSGVLPNLNDNRFLEGSTGAGQSKEAGLPNIQGNFPTPGFKDSGAKWEGAFFTNGQNTGVQVANNGAPDLQCFMDASRCSGIYGKSGTVQPKSYTVTYYICYA